MNKTIKKAVNVALATPVWFLLDRVIGPHTHFFCCGGERRYRLMDWAAAYGDVIYDGWDSIDADGRVTEAYFRRILGAIPNEPHQLDLPENKED